MHVFPPQRDRRSSRGRQPLIRLAGPLTGSLASGLRPCRFRTPLAFFLLVNLLSLCLLGGCTSVMQQADEAFMSNDFSRAHSLYMQAWEEPKAQYRLAIMYLDGEGVPQSNGKALKWMGLAAQNNYPAALRDLGEWFMNGKVVPLEPGRGAGYLSRAAHLGDGKAMYLLGLAYEGGLGVPQSNESAQALFRNAAKAGYHVPSLLIGD